MIHFTCDVCGAELSKADDQRYVVQIDIRPAQSPWELSEDDLEADNLEKVSELLSEAEATGEDPFVDAAPVRIHFDLCTHCRDRYLKDPLNCHPSAKFNFSEN